jgi:long chain fatty acid CoA FadD26
MAPSYGLAEAMVYAASAPRTNRPVVARFDYEKLAAGYAESRENETGVDLVSIGAPRACAARIVDPETRTENPAGKVGEVWLLGDNIAAGYWRNPEESENTFGGRLVDPSNGTPAGPWLRTGDLGVMTGGEFYLVGRIKDVLIVDGRNHYPDDIEATIQELSGGRVAAVAVPNGSGEQLVAVVEVKNRGTDDDAVQRLRDIKRNVASAVSRNHGVRIADLVLVDRGAIPITTSGKIRRSACADRYRQDGFARLDASASLEEADALR